MDQLIKSMSATIHKSRGLGIDGLEMSVSVSFDSKLFNQIKKNSDPLAAAMGQIKNVVLDATGVRGIPSYSAVSMNQRFPRASKGVVTLTVCFDVSEYTARELGVDTSKWTVHHSIDLNPTLEATRDDGHLFAKSAIASQLGH